MENRYDSRDKQVVAMINAGQPSREIMIRFSLSKGQFAGIRHRAKSKNQVTSFSKDRIEDETILRAIDLRFRSFSLKKTASLVGHSVMWVTGRTQAVLAADLEQSGEKLAIVRGAYW